MSGGEARDDELSRLLREAADERLFAGLSFDERLRAAVRARTAPAGQAAEGPGGAAVPGGTEEPRRAPADGTGSAPPGGWLARWRAPAAWAALGAAAVLALVVAGDVVRRGSLPGAAGGGRLPVSQAERPKEGAGEEAAGAPSGDAFRSEQEAQRSRAAAPAEAQRGRAGEAGDAGGDAPKLDAFRAASGEPASPASPAPSLAARARREGGGVRLELRVGGVAGERLPRLSVVGLFPGGAERRTRLVGCTAEAGGWRCGAVLADVPGRETRVTVRLVEPAGAGGEEVVAEAGAVPVDP